MKKVIWLIGDNKREMIEAQHNINSTGSMRAICMLSFDAVEKVVSDPGLIDHSSMNSPSMIVLDYDMSVKDDFAVLSYLKNQRTIAAVPLFFMANVRSQEVDEECYARGAMVVVKKPFSSSAIMRIERMAWQNEVTRNYEKVLTRQADNLKAAREIVRLNQQLKLRNDFLHRIFGRYFSDDVVKVLLDNPEGASVGGQRKFVAVMMADIRGFTAISDNLEPKAMTDLLNVFFGNMEYAIQKYHGTIIELLGDCVLSVFGAPLDSSYCVRDCISAAICMQNSMEEINDYCRRMNYPEIEIGIGINSGEAFIGNIGTERMMRYNVLGEVVNECSRIEHCSVGGQILIPEETLAQAGCEYEIAGNESVKIKGVRKPINVCDLVRIKGEEILSLKNRKTDELKSINNPYCIRLKMIIRKMVNAQEITAKLIAWSKQSLLLELPEDTIVWERQEQIQFEDVELTLHLQDTMVDQIYAKIIAFDKSGLRLRFTYIPQEWKETLWKELEGNSL